jgi:hypothetical protein
MNGIWPYQGTLVLIVGCLTVFITVFIVTITTYNENKFPKDPDEH